MGTVPSADTKLLIRASRKRAQRTVPDLFAASSHHAAQGNSHQISKQRGATAEQQRLKPRRIPRL